MAESLLDLGGMTNQAIAMGNLYQHVERNRISAEQNVIDRERIQEQAKQRQMVERFKAYDELEKQKSDPLFVTNPIQRTMLRQRQMHLLGLPPASAEELLGAEVELDDTLKLIRDPDADPTAREAASLRLMGAAPGYGKQIFESLKMQQDMSMAAQRNHVLIQRFGAELTRLNQLIGRETIRNSVLTENIGKLSGIERVLTEHRPLLSSMAAAKTDEERNNLRRMKSAEVAQFDLDRKRAIELTPLDMGKLYERRQSLLDKRAQIQKLGKPIPPELDEEIAALELSHSALYAAERVMEDPFSPATRRTFQTALEDVQLAYRTNGTRLSSLRQERDDLRERQIARLEAKDERAVLANEHLVNMQTQFAEKAEEEQTPQLAAALIKKAGYKDVTVEDVLKANPLKFKKPATEITLNDRKLTPEQSGRVAAMSRSISELDDVRKLIVKEDGSIDRTNVFASSFNLPFSEGRDVTRFIEDAIETKLRLETGAAANRDEVKRIARRFKPANADTDTTIIGKLDQLRAFMTESFNILDPTGEIRGRIPNQQVGKPPQDFRTRFDAIKKQHPDWDQTRIFQQMSQEGY